MTIDYKRKPDSRIKYIKVEFKITSNKVLDSIPDRTYYKILEDSYNI